MVGSKLPRSWTALTKSAPLQNLGAEAIYELDTELVAPCRRPLPE